MTYPIICISPHADDAALSCGGLLAAQSAQGRPALAVTVFAGFPPAPETLTPFARQLHHEWGDAPDPMALRREEDSRALAVLGCAGETWDYLDAIYRHPAYSSNERLFGPLAGEDALEKELRDRCAALPGDLLLFPLAVGRHVDHQLIFRVGSALLDAGYPVAFYEDLPYVAWEGSPAPRLAELRRPLWPHLVEMTSFWPTKVAAISCYASQLSSLLHDGISLLHAVQHYAAALSPAGYAERLWSAEARLVRALALRERARALYAETDTAHDFAHVLRVLTLVWRIGPAEGADMHLLEAATLLHDIARADEVENGVDHAQVGAERARQIVRQWGYSPAEAEAIARIIAAHRFRNDSPPETVEEKVLYDADKLDAIGAIGVGRAFAYAGRTGQRLWSAVPADARATQRVDPASHTPSIEFAVKLSRLAGALHTATARAIARERHAFMRAFFERLDKEVRGDE